MSFFIGFADELCKIAKVSKSPFVGSIEKLTESNKNFRKVLFTGEHSQLVLMTVKPGEDLGEEVHNDIDQFFRIEEGEAIFVLNGKKHRQKAGGSVVIPSGTKHNIINASKTAPLRVYSIYSPPKHPAGTLHRSKLDALKAEMGKKADEEEGGEATGKMPKNIDQVLTSFFKAHPKPNDDQIHELAEAHNVSPHALETKIYAILGKKMKKQAAKRKCPPGKRWCPIRKKCIPGEKPGLGMGRGAGRGPLGIPAK
jgi:mannose-6-phosphate isomerase-like protein (cupin superfamily)